MKQINTAVKLIIVVVRLWSYFMRNTFLLLEKTVKNESNNQHTDFSMSDFGSSLLLQFNLHCFFSFVPFYSSRLFFIEWFILHFEYVL